MIRSVVEIFYTKQFSFCSKRFKEIEKVDYIGSLNRSLCISYIIFTSDCFFSFSSCRRECLDFSFSLFLYLVLIVFGSKNCCFLVEKIPCPFERYFISGVLFYTYAKSKYIIDKFILCGSRRPRREDKSFVLKGRNLGYIDGVYSS